jgi:hypothetical protein
MVSAPLAHIFDKSLTHTSLPFRKTAVQVCATTWRNLVRGIMVDINVVDLRYKSTAFETIAACDIAHEHQFVRV